ncbi:MAG: lysylphosphatidylglycerol synthase transmembrane domain-containing protein [Planctomycetota bacterium]
MPERAVPTPKPYAGRVIFAVKLTVSIALLVYMLIRADAGAVWSKITGADTLPLFLACLTPFVGYWLISLRWKRLLTAARVRVRQRPLYRASMIAMFYNQLLPSTVGGDVARGIEAHRAGVPKATALSSLVVDRIIGIVALAVLAAITLPLVDDYPGRPMLLYVVVWGAALMMLAAIATIFSPHESMLSVGRAVYRRLPRPFARAAKKIDDSVDGYRGRPGVFAAAFVSSVVLQLNVVLMHWLIASALAIEINFVTLVLVVPLALIVMLAPVTINGIGIREGIFTVLLAAYGVSETQAVAMALLVYAVFLLHGILGGMVVLGGTIHRRNRAAADGPAARPEPAGRHAGGTPHAAVVTPDERPVHRDASSTPRPAAQAPAQTASAGTPRSPSDTP